jgi:hypothetical protein
MADGLRDRGGELSIILLLYSVIVDGPGSRLGSVVYGRRFGLALRVQVLLRTHHW